MTNKENPQGKKKKNLGKLIAGLTIMTAVLASTPASAAPPNGGDCPIDSASCPSDPKPSTTPE